MTAAMTAGAAMTVAAPAGLPALAWRSTSAELRVAHGFAFGAAATADESAAAVSDAHCGGHGVGADASSHDGSLLDGTGLDDSSHTDGTTALDACQSKIRTSTIKIPQISKNISPDTLITIPPQDEV